MNGLALATVSIERVEGLRARRGERFDARFFTIDERAYCEPRRNAGQHYAARLAAKFAVWRLLGPVRLSEVEVRRDQAGAPSLQLHGNAAFRAGTRRFLLSLSHEGGVAMALVVGDEA